MFQVLGLTHIQNDSYVESNDRLVAIEMIEIGFFL